MSQTRKMKIMDVTPAVAERWLEKNTINRDLKQSKAEEYAAIMKRGAWQLTTQGISFAKPHTDSAGDKHEEALIDGQHRLWAVILSGCTVKFTVWWGCEPEEFGAIDQGLNRTQGDILQTIRPDLEHPTRIVSVIVPVKKWICAHKGKLVTNETELFLRNFPQELDLAVDCKNKLGRIATAPVQAALFACILIDPAKVSAMVERLHSAVGLTERDPVRALHLYLNAQRDPAIRDSNDHVLYKTLHACLAQIDGRPLVRLQPSLELVGEARRRIKPKIDQVVRQLHGGKLPNFFYTPRTGGMRGTAEEAAPVLAGTEKE